MTLAPRSNMHKFYYLCIGFCVDFAFLITFSRLNLIRHTFCAIYFFCSLPLLRCGNQWKEEILVLPTSFCNWKKEKRSDDKDKCENYSWADILPWNFRRHFFLSTQLQWTSITERSYCHNVIEHEFPTQ